MALMGYREYARHRGCALSAVQKAIRTGRIEAKDLKIDPDAADLAWVSSTDPAKQRKEPPPPPPAPTAPLFAGEAIPAPASLARHVEWSEITEPWPPPVVRRPDPEPMPNNVTGMDTFLLAKTDRERAEAELAKIKLAETQSRLIDAVEARQTWQAIGAMFARSREVVPVALATKLVEKSDPKEIERIIRAEFRESDRKIADEIAARFADRVNDVRSLAS
jgi:DNA-binding protein YbaB